MKLTNFSLAALTLAVAFSPALNADVWNKKTLITTTESLQIPGKLLPPGKYVLKLVESQSNRHIVQVMNEAEDKVEATIIAIPNYRLQPTGNTRFGFWETPAGTPRALRSWFYPGDNFGQEFAYPKSFATSISASNKDTVPVLNEDSGTTTQVATRSAVTEPAPAAVEVAKVETTPEPTPVPTPSVAVVSDPTPTPTPVAANNADQSTVTPSNASNQNSGMNSNRLPATASSLPLIALGGLLMLSAGLSLSAYSRR